MATATFQWPKGQSAALSITFDDARPSQFDGIQILDRFELPGTFYVSLPAFEKRLDDWRAAAANGHEMGNHTVTHPCSCNFPFIKDNSLESLTLERMERELDDANQRITELIGRTPTSFAYPCGQTFVGRGVGVQSYVPLVASRFVVGRGFYDEGANAPTLCDLAQVYGVPFDAMTFEQVEPMLENCLSRGAWLALAGHDVRDTGRQSVLPKTLEAICQYAIEHDIWVDTVANIGAYVKANRSL